MTKSTKKSQKNNFDVSVVVVSYNTKDILKNCLDSLKNENLKMQIIVSDNGSTDGSAEMIKKQKTHTWCAFELLENNENLGFAAGNNRAKKHVKSDYVLFLNSDTIVEKNSIKTPLHYIKAHDDVGAITCKVVLPNGKLDPDTRRAFPTPLTALKHFTGFSKTYRYLHIHEDEVHDVDAIQGAFLLTRKSILDKVGWFDEDYFLDGEDIDLCWRIKQVGYRLIYYPLSKITHIKKASKKTDRKKSLKSVLRGVEAMEIFYKKHLKQTYPFFVNWMVSIGISTLKLARIIKYELT